MAKKPKNPKRITRYTHDSATDPATPETGHTPLIGEEQVVALEMDNGWSKAIKVGKLPDTDIPVVVDMEPAYDPVLFWAGKRSRRQVPLLPLQRNEVVSESRIARIIERARDAASKEPKPEQTSMFADIEKALREIEREKRVEFYTHEEGWKNKLICGDSLELMESLIHYEDLRGKVQMIYVDPPYGVKYDSNFQQRVDSTSNDDKDRADDVLTIKAFHDTWMLGIHSYLEYLYERLYICRDLLAESGSIFVQISDGNVHRVRSLLDEVFGASNFCAEIAFAKTSGFTPKLISSVFDVLLWYGKSRDALAAKYNQLYEPREPIENPYERYICVETSDGRIIDLSVAQKLGREPIPAGRLLRLQQTSSQGASEGSGVGIEFEGRDYYPPSGRHWSVTPDGLRNVIKTGRVAAVGNTLTWKQYRDEFPYKPINNIWTGIRATGFGETKWFVVQTLPEVVRRCIAMTTDPGDLVFDPTCGSGTTAICAEELGRRWITCDTARVAINVARKRLLSAVFDHYRTHGDTPSSGFPYRTAERITLRSLAYELEPEKIELVDRPETDVGAVRVCGPFEVLTLGRYAAEDWTGYLVEKEGGRLENYIAAICRLYRTGAALQDSAGVIHAVQDSADGSVAMSVGPISGRVTARQIYDSATEAEALGIPEVHVLGWAFEANVGEVKSEIDSAGKVKIQLVMIRPDSLAEGLKVTKPEMLFSPLALPDVQLDAAGKGRFTVTLKGIALFDRKTKVTEFKHAASGYVSAWYLDEDYDSDCFVDCQMFFDFKKKPAIEKTLGIQADPDEWTLRLTSDPFERGKYRCIAVKVVDVFGNESAVVKSLP